MTIKDTQSPQEISNQIRRLYRAGDTLVLNAVCNAATLQTYGQTVQPVRCVNPDGSLTSFERWNRLHNDLEIAWTQTFPRQAS